MTKTETLEFSGKDDTLFSEDDVQPIAMEDILKELGIPGRYQTIQIFCTLICLLPFAFVMLNFAYIGYEPPHQCQEINETELLIQHNVFNESTAGISYGSCDIILSINRTGQEEKVISLGCYGGYTYIGGKHVSMVSEWDLVCDKRGIVQFVQSAFTLGLTISAIFLTSIADRFGRKYIYILTSFTLMVTEFGLVFTESIYGVIALRFFSGISAMGMYLTHYVLNIELVISKYRQTFAFSHIILWSITIMILSGTAFLFRNTDWRHFQLIVPIICIPIFLGVIFVYETPSWYFAKGRHENVRQILDKACKMNRKDVIMVQEMFSNVVQQDKINRQTKKLKETTSKVANYTIFDIARNRDLLKPVCILAVAWFTNSLAYYGLFLTSSALAGNRFLNFFLMALIEIPSSLTAMTMLVYLGRRTVILVFFVLSGCCLLISTILVSIEKRNADVSNASTAFFLLGKFTIGACFGGVSSYTPEIFPTTLRSGGTGLCGSFARIGGTLAPFMLPLFQMMPWAPGTILTFLCFSCAIAIPMLPETRGKQLPVSIEEYLAWKKKTKVQNNKKSVSVSQEDALC